jgi:predicted transcriptional regulator
MASELTKLTAQIVIAHASMTELTPQELVKALKEVHQTLASLPTEKPVAEAVPKPRRTRRVRQVKMVESPEAKAVEDEEKSPWGDPDYMEFMESREG